MVGTGSHIAKQLGREVALECSRVAALIGTEDSTPQTSYTCTMCPLRAFTRGPRSLLKHMMTDHCEHKHFVCSGTKQVKVLMAVYDYDMLTSRQPFNLLKRSASTMRDMI